jgi:predicted NBD/HSP70 family sugar kinase
MSAFPYRSGIPADADKYRPDSHSDNIQPTGDRLLDADDDYLTEMQEAFEQWCFDDDGRYDEPPGHLVDGVLDHAARLGEGRFAVGIELLPYQLVGVLLDGDGRRLGDGQRCLDSMNEASVVEAIAELVTDLLGVHLGMDVPDDRVTVCVQVGGPTKDNVVIYYHKNPPDTAGTPLFPEVRWTENFDLAGPLRELLHGVRTLVVNDADAYAEYQRQLGAGREYDRFGVVVIREGVGGSLVWNHRLLDAPIEIGNMLVRPGGGRVCDCGQQGCLEVSAGTTGITETASTFADQEVRSIVDAAALVEQDNEAARKARAAFTGAGAAAAKGIATFLTMLSPPLVVLYGPAVLVEPGTVASDAFLKEAGEFRAFVSHKPFGECELVVMPLRPYDGAHGAALIALERGVVRTLRDEPGSPSEAGRQ